MLRFALALCLICLTAPLAASEASDALLRHLGMERSVDIMRREGIAYADELAQDMVPSGPTTGFRARVRAIYDATQMEALVREGFAAHFEGEAGAAAIAPLAAFFGAKEGQRIVQLELSTREALIDSEIEEAAKERARGFERARDDIFLQVEEFIAVNDLIEANVIGSMNSNMRFYQGLVDGGAFRFTEAEILADVRAQEDEARRETRDWLLGFLTMAYLPLDPGEMEHYIALSRSAEGQRMTQALFAGFDAMQDEISYALGLAIAEAMLAQDT